MPNKSNRYEPHLALAALTLLGCGSAVAPEPGVVATKLSRSSTITLSDDNARVAMVNPEDNSLSVFQTSDNARLSKIATGGAPGHQLVLDHALRPLFGSLGATVVPTGIYGTDAQFTGDAPHPDLVRRIDRAVLEALAIAGATNLSLSTTSAES